MERPIPRRGFLFILPFGAILVLAVGFTTVGPTLAWALPGLTWWEATLLSVAPFAAIGAASLLAGRAADRAGYRKSLLAGMALLPVGLLLPLASTSFPVLLATFLCLGLCSAAVQTSANPLVAGLFPEKPGTALTFLHVGWSVGAFAGPVLAGAYFTSGDVRGLFGTAAGLAALFFAGALLTHRKLPDLRPPPRTPRAGKGGLLPLLILLGFFYAGAEMGVNVWLPAHLQSGGADPGQAGLALGVFWGSMGAGRVVLGPFLDKVGLRRMALLMAFLGLGSLVANGLLPGGPPAARWALAGFAFSILFPASMAFAARHYPGETGAAVGAVFGIGILGAVAVPGLIGVLQPAFGPAAFLAGVTGSLAGLVAVLLHPRLAEAERRMEKTGQ